ncbi:MAG: hypothetical protein LBS82_05035 [Spirochaetaceae bacterium]|jgi:hypothetical protein|nr:hypothetical protein [Spirochaetaceae bacterium]
MMDLPNNQTFEVLDRRKNYLVQKMQTKDNNSYMQAEISALDKVMTFSKYILNNFPHELIMEIIEKIGLEDKTSDETEDDKNYEVLYSYERSLSKEFKIDVSFIRYKENEQILLVYKKYKKTMFKWAYQGKIRITQAILEEILDKCHEITTK